jgi:YD repeat-containing protein
MFGPHWKSIYEERVYVASSGMMEYSAGDGSFTYFVLSGGVWTAAVPSSPTTVLTPGSSYWTLTFPSGETRFFNNTSGSLISIKDRNGNATQITYDSLGRMSTVTDSASRHLYFAYASNTSLLVSAVTSDVGLALSYTYDNQGRLVTVTNPDLSTENFQYNDPTHSYLITAVKDSQGKILESHTYDSAGRGLTGSRANGVEAVSIAYSN